MSTQNPATDSAGARLVDALARSITLRMLIANGIGALLVLAISVLAYPALYITRHTAAVSVTVTGLYLLAVSFWGPWWGRRLFQPVARRLREGGALNDAERRRALHQPFLQVAWAFLYWIGAATLFGLLNSLYFGIDTGLAMRAVMVTLLGGLTTSAVAFFLLEREYRPVFTIALSEESPRPGRLFGIRRRLLLSWALSSGIPLLGIVIAAAGGGDIDRTRLAILIGVLGAVGLVTGAITMQGAARSVTDRTEALRSAMARLRDGDLAAAVTVDDAGEIGQLQTGFNAMVQGLREREALREVFGRHVGAEVARQALQRTDLGGELRDVSILFVDVIGSTALAQRSEPAEMVALLNLLFDVVVRVVRAERGWVNKFEGDAALCIFGAPERDDEHAAHACRAARMLRLELCDMALHHPDLDAAIGVASGTVVAGNVGASQRYEYTVIGDPVNEAARLGELAKTDAGRVLASAEAVARAGDEATEWIAAGIDRLRGRAEPTQMFKPAGSPLR